MDRQPSEWIDVLATRLAGVGVDPALELTLVQRIDDVDVWTVRLSGGQATVVAGGDPAPDIRLSCDRATAEAIRDGRLSPQRAFLDGRLRIGGDVAAMIEHRAALAAIVPAT